MRQLNRIVKDKNETNNNKNNENDLIKGINLNIMHKDNEVKFIEKDLILIKVEDKQVNKEKNSFQIKQDTNQIQYKDIKKTNEKQDKYLIDGNKDIKNENNKLFTFIEKYKNEEKSITDSGGKRYK